MAEPTWEIRTVPANSATPDGLYVVADPTQLVARFKIDDQPVELVFTLDPEKAAYMGLLLCELAVREGATTTKGPLQ